MGFYNNVYFQGKCLRYSKTSMKGWLVGIFSQILMLEEYCLKIIGGPLCIKMLLNYVKIVIFANA
jgi:hypothetical protein